MAVVAAEELGLEPADITVHVGDTRFPEGPASGGSVTTNSVGARRAPRRPRGADAALRPGRARSSSAKPEELDAADGKIFVAAEPARSVTFSRRRRRCRARSSTASPKRKKQFETFRSDLAGTQFAEVEVDIETGVVRVLKMVVGERLRASRSTRSPRRARSSARMIQGASWALFENRILDRNVGTMVNPNLECVQDPRPRGHVRGRVDLHPGGQRGEQHLAAGIGEPPIVPTLAAIANAVFNATGVRVRAAADHAGPGARGPGRSAEEGLAMNRFELARATSAAAGPRARRREAGQRLQGRRHRPPRPPEGAPRSSPRGSWT